MSEFIYRADREILEGVKVDQGDIKSFLESREAKLIKELIAVRIMLGRLQGFEPEIDYTITE